MHAIPKRGQSPIKSPEAIRVPAEDVEQLAGGLDAWKQAGLPLDRK